MISPLGLICVAVGSGVAIAVWRGLSRHALRKLRCRGGSILYGPTVGTDEAVRLRDYLERTAFFGAGRYGAELRREAGVYQLRVPGARDVGGDEEVVARCGVIAAALAGEVFRESAVEVQLCDSWFQTLLVVPHRARYGERLRFNAAEVFCGDGVAEDQAVRVGTYLMSQGFFNDNPKLAQINRAGDAFELRLEVKAGCASNPELREEFRRMAGDLSRDVLRGSLVEVVPCESVHETLRDQGGVRTPGPKGDGTRVFIGRTSFRPPTGGPDPAPPAGDAPGV